MKVALVHDYLTQRGGAERVVLAMAKAFPDAPVHTAFYEPSGTFREFSDIDVRPLRINNLGVLRRDHRRALPLLSRAFDNLNIDADVVLCSSSGWAHGAHTSGRKVVYCHTPARWLYQADRYTRAGTPLRRLGLSLVRERLVAWDAAAAATANVYLANSSIVRDRIQHIYGIDAEVLSPPQTIDPTGTVRDVGIAAGYFLCVARLIPHKNVDALVQAFATAPQLQLVVVGAGPDGDRLRRLKPGNVTLLEHVDDAELRWLYQHCHAVVSAAHEDFGLTPLEGGAFGRPSVVLRYGGFLDTVSDGATGIFFDGLGPDAITAALGRALETRWDADAIRRHTDQFNVAAFTERLRAILEHEVELAR
ncbi:MAG TPA: glycosyltransferase [Gaiellaceae bacterium]|jgi:glycosyltransferase involved in cell wall biosynthesis